MLEAIHALMEGDTDNIRPRDQSAHNMKMCTEGQLRETIIRIQTEPKEAEENKGLTQGYMFLEHEATTETTQNRCPIAMVLHGPSILRKAIGCTDLRHAREQDASVSQAV